MFALVAINNRVAGSGKGGHKDRPYITPFTIKDLNIMIKLTHLVRAAG